MGYLGNDNTITGTQNSKRIIIDATPNQTISTVTGGYTIGQLDVYRNGVNLLTLRTILREMVPASLLLMH